MKKFNITGKCIPELHYMVDISERIERIKNMVDAGDYLCINRGRQYGKTTTLSMLKRRLDHEYAVFSLSLESVGEAELKTGETLASAILWMLNQKIITKQVSCLAPDAVRYMSQVTPPVPATMSTLVFGATISTFCQLNEQPVVLLIDEVDQASNYDSFIKLLGVLRDKFLNRDNEPTFKSVILAGVYDIKNIKLKLRPEEQHKTTSPWNIATPFNEDMALSAKGIMGMLNEYENDHKTGMDVQAISTLVYDYTAGYPFLAVRLCMLMDESGNWTKEGFLDATKSLLNEDNTLFKDTSKKLDDFPDLRDMIYRMLFLGEEFPYNPQNKPQELGKLFNFIDEEDGKVIVANRLLETWFYNLFFTDEKLKNRIYNNGVESKPEFIKDGQLNMELILERFSRLYDNLYDNQRDERFDEEEGRKKFLFYVKPIINGIGNYYVEARTRNMRRTDLVIDYLGKQYIVEMKIWHGEQYNLEGEEQLADYLEAHDLDTGYMLTFNFNKRKKNKMVRKTVKGKELLEYVL